MIKKILSFLLILQLISCNSPIESTDYLGQIHPDTIPVVFAPGIVSIQGRLEQGISVTPDTQEIAFGLLNKDNSGEIQHVQKIHNDWLEPTVFEPLKGKSTFLPYFSPDGKSMVYAKSVSDTLSYITDIWILTKTNDQWGNAKKISPPISTTTREATACMTLDNTIYFSSNRGGNGLADLYTSSLDNGVYSSVQRIDAISSVRDEESIFVAPDETYIIFSRYTQNENGPDLFISYQDANKNWTTPRLVDATINTKNWERRPFVSIDNKFLFFTTFIFSPSGAVESDIYWVTTQKVFKPFVFNPITEKTIPVGKETTLHLPSDYFKDIDDAHLEIKINQEEVPWAKFDTHTMTLTLHPTQVGSFNLILTATDQSLNKTNHTIAITVEN